MTLPANSPDGFTHRPGMRAVTAIAIMFGMLSLVSFAIAAFGFYKLAPSIDYCMNQPIPASIYHDGPNASFTYKNSFLPLGINCIWFSDKGSAGPRRISTFTDAGTVPLALGLGSAALALGAAIAGGRAKERRASN
jgi:hypothetical protein